MISTDQKPTVCRALRAPFLAVTALLAADALAGLIYRTGTAASTFVVRPRSGTTKRLLVVFPGFIMPGEELTAAFAPHLEPDDAMVVVHYAERGLDIDDIYHHVMMQAARLNPGSVTIYGVSMGGMCAAQFLDLYHRAEASYGAATLILDTAPSGAADIKRPGWLLAVSSWYRGGPLTTAVWALGSALGSEPEPEPGADRTVIAAARRRGAWAGMPAITSQAAYITRFARLCTEQQIDTPAHVAYLCAEADPLIRLGPAIRGWRRVFPGLEVMTVTGRQTRWHVPIIERPQETMRAISSAVELLRLPKKASPEPGA